MPPPELISDAEARRRATATPPGGPAPPDAVPPPPPGAGEEALRQALARRERELAAVLKISRALSSQLRLDDLVRGTLEVSLEAVHASAGSILLYDEKRRCLVFRYVVNPDQPEVAQRLAGQTIAPDRGIAGRVFRSRTASIDADPADRPEHLREIGENVGYVTHNIATAPLVSMEARAIGVMQALNKAGGPFEQEDLELLSIMATQAATAIETARLYEEARLAAIMHYLGDISHDIKNLMSPAQMGVETLGLVLDATFARLDDICDRTRDNASLTEEVRHACQSLRALYPETVALAMEGILATQDRVREIADAVKGVIAKPVFEPASVNEVLMGVAKALLGMAERHGVALDTEGLQPLPAIPIDKKRLYNAVYNLVQNALPETPAGGRVFLRTVAEESGSFPEGAFVQVEVADTGRGMEDGVRRRLFTDDAISTKPGGTGLGTRIVKNVMDAHGGEVTVETRPGEGTCFRLKLPLRRPGP